MEKLILDEARKIWTEIAQHKTPADLKVEVEIYKRMLNIFQVGDYYYMIFNPPELTIEYTSDSITHVLGYLPHEFTLNRLMKSIHSDDLPYFMDFEATVTKFFKQLPVDKVMKYKVRYDYRIRTQSGQYKRILQQIVTAQSDLEGAVLRTFVVHTDISHLKRDHKMVLSFIGLEGEPSYIDVQPIRKFTPSKEVLTKREKEILLWLAKHKTSAEIADILFMSPSTVATHRRNMLRKTGTHNALELISLAVERGWL